MSRKVFIGVDGCDDSTAFKLTVTADELELLKKLEQITGKFGGGCKPVIVVTTEPEKYTEYENGDEVADE